MLRKLTPISGGVPCLIENCPNERAVEFCHVVSRQLSLDSPLVSVSLVSSPFIPDGCLLVDG